MQTIQKTQKMSENAKSLISKLWNLGFKDAADYIEKLTEDEKIRIYFRESEHIIGAFLWKKTPQGFDYWDNIDSKMRKNNQA